MNEIEKKAPRGKSRVIGVTPVSQEYLLKDFDCPLVAKRACDSMNAGRNVNLFYLYDDQGVLVRGPKKAI